MNKILSSALLTMALAFSTAAFATQKEPQHEEHPAAPEAEATPEAAHVEPSGAK